MSHQLWLPKKAFTADADPHLANARALEAWAQVHVGENDDHSGRHEAGGADEVDGWQVLGRTTLAAAGDTITVDSLPARKFLKIEVHALNSGSIAVGIRFNNDSGNNYAWRAGVNQAADVTSTSTNVVISSVAGTETQMFVGEVVNLAAQEKLLTGHVVHRNTAGAASAPGREEWVGKWTNTADQITRVDVINASTGDFAAGSTVVVLGHN